MAQAAPTRCAGCRHFIPPRPDWDDDQAEEAAYTADRFQEHECSLDYHGASLAPREGEEDAYLASLEAEVLEEAEAIVEAAAVAAQSVKEAPTMTQTQDQQPQARPVVDLKVAAAEYRAKVDLAHTERARKEAEEYRERAALAGQDVWDRTLAQDLAQAGVEVGDITWTAVPRGEGSSGNTKAATAVVQGLRFLAEERYRGYDYGGYSYDLYLLRPCGKHDPAAGVDDQRTEISSLYGLARVLAKPEEASWSCPTCGWLAYEAAEERRAAEPARVPTLGERLEALVRELVDDALASREV